MDYYAKHSRVNSFDERNKEAEVATSTDSDIVIATSREPTATSDDDACANKVNSNTYSSGLASNEESNKEERGEIEG